MPIFNLRDILISLLDFRSNGIPYNGNDSFLATNMREFWTKYHMSLSAFWDYIHSIASYYRKPLFSILATMLIIGIWHRISMRYLLWGLLQAFGVYISSIFQINQNRLL
jgi:alginate O-acetyltransferase complex protein AlgI